MNVGYLVGASGLVKRSDDDGATWVVKTQPTPTLLINRISANNSNFDSIVVIARASIFYSTDGGTTWSVPSGNWAASITVINEDFNSIKRSKHNEDYIWISAENKLLYLSTDNGVSFNKVNTPTGVDGAVGAYSIADVEFWDADTGVILLTSGGVGTQLWKTTNQGVSWVNLSPVLSLAYYSNQGVRTFNNGQIIYVASGAYFFKSVDGGVNFTNSTPFIFGTIAGFFSCPSPNRIYLGGGDAGIYRSTDAGLTFDVISYAAGSGVVCGAGDWIDDDNGLYSQNTNTPTYDTFRDSDGLVTFPTSVIEASASPIFDLIYIAPASAPPPPPIQGCTDVNSCNYDPLAVIDDGSCDYRYELTDCNSVEANVITDTDLSAQVGKVIKTAEGTADVCWSVSRYTADCVAGTGVTITVTESNNDCEDCLEIIGCTDPNACNYDPLATVSQSKLCTYRFRLTDCDGIESDIISEEDLFSEVGRVVTLATTGDTCWQVSYYTDDCNPILSGVVVTSYVDCVTCNPPPLPFETTLGNIAVDSKCSMITFDDESNYSTAVEEGHSMSDFDTYRVITITRFNGETYTLSSLGDGDEVITTGSTGDINFAYLFQTDIDGNIIDEDGLYDVDICNYPTWSTLAAYDIVLNPEIVVYYNGVLYKALSSSTGSQPDLVIADWEVYTPTVQEKSLSRYCSRLKIVVLCLSILDCYDKKVLDSVCSDKDFCSDYAVCNNDSLLDAMKIRLMIDAVENSVDNIQYDEVIRQIDIMKQICNC